MDETAFRAALARDGFTEVLQREVPAGTELPEHHHAWDSRVLVLAGALRLTHAGRRVDYGPGQAFDVPRGEPHAESHGPQGATLLVGRRHPGAA